MFQGGKQRGWRTGGGGVKQHEVEALGVKGKGAAVCSELALRQTHQRSSTGMSRDALPPPPTHTRCVCV